MFPFKTKFRLIKGPFKTGFTVLVGYHDGESSRHRWEDGVKMNLNETR
jgi:hypothetical protein